MHPTGDCDIECDVLLTSCSGVIASLLSRKQDGLANYVFSTVIKTVLSHVSTVVHCVVDVIDHL